MPGSKSIFTMSEASFSKVSFSTAQLKGGSILRLIIVPRGPVFLITRSLVIGLLGTFFSHKYLKSNLEKLNERLGVMKLPNTFEL